MSPTSPGSPTNSAQGQSLTHSLARTNDDVNSYYSSATHEQSPSISEPYESENMAGLGAANRHPFGHHPYAYNSGIGGVKDDGGAGEKGAGADAVQFGHAS